MLEQSLIPLLRRRFLPARRTDTNPMLAQNMGTTISEHCTTSKQTAEESIIIGQSKEENLAVVSQESCKFTQTWTILNKRSKLLSPDAQFWWRATGFPLAALMEAAGYDLHSQYSGLIFHMDLIVPHLGPKPSLAGPPTHWRSFMTDEFSPIEYSWNWGTSSQGPAIRYSIEAVGPQAGTAQDPVNCIEIYKLLEKLKLTEPTLDLRWFNILMREFIGTPRAAIQTVDPSQSHPSSVFAAFELQNGELATKAYFVPVKAEQLGVSRFKLLSETIKSLESEKIRFPAHKVLTNFLDKHEHQHNFRLVGAAIDCVKPDKSRMKIYMRSSRTSFASVCQVMSLNDALATLKSGAYDELSSLWHQLLDLDADFPIDKDLPTLRHEHAGVLYNIDIKAGSVVPETKVYIPVGRYGRNDLSIVQGLRTYMEGKGRWQHGQAYLRALSAIGAHRALDDGTGLQTYISCTIKKGELAVTSYIAPEVYHRNQWAGDM